MNIKRLLTRHILLSCLALMSMSAWAQAKYQPKANDAAVVQSGKARFTVLTPEMIRIQYSSNQQFEDRGTFGVVNRNLPVPAYTTREEGGYLYITTDALELRYKKGATLRTSTPSPTNLQITMKVNGRTEVWYPGKDDALNLRGTQRTLDNVPGDTFRNSLEQGILSRSGWAIIDESPATRRGDNSTSYAFQPTEGGYDWASPQLDATATDWYFLGYGHNYKKALGDFCKVAGNIPLPPKYMFGYWYSRYWAYSQADFLALIKDIENNNIPLDIMIMDMDWHRSGWTGWSWNKSLIPNPTGLINYMHNHGTRVALNLHPADGVGAHEDNYQMMKNDLGNKGTYANDGAILWQVENQDYINSLFKNILRPLEKDGVDFWWLDWQQKRTVGEHAIERGYQCPSGYEGLSETFWCNHVFFNDMQTNRPDRRPIIYHRWGGLGSHRYQIGFSGDTYPTWATLQAQPYFTSTASNVGYGYWGHDLGGHQYDPDCNNPERYLRWMQFGVFTPIFRTHATNDGRIERRIWKFNNFKNLRETVVLRYALFPYIYTAARQAYDTGVCMNRPLYYDYPEASNAYQFEDEYMFGDNILVAPVVSPAGEDKLAERTTWLPEGYWWDVTKKRLVKGDVIYTEKYALTEIPYYYKAGSVIVNFPYQRTVMTTPETIILQVAPGGEGFGDFYEDNGDDRDYATNYANTHYTCSANTTGVTLNIGGRTGQFDGMPTKRTYQVQLLGALGAATSAKVDGKDVESSYNEKTGIITVNIPMTDLAVGVTLSVVAPFCEAETLTDEYQPTVAPEVTNAKLWITGEAVPGGTQPLETFPGNRYKFHGTLNPGKLYIIDTPTETATTHYYTPSRKYSNIVGNDMGYVSRTSKTDAEWEVAFAADNYRFTVSTSDRKVKGELFKWPLEIYIVGGAVADGQEQKWLLEKTELFTQSTTDRNVWTWVGELKNRKSNTESNYFKLLAQKDWGPVHYHPFTHGENISNASQIWTNGDDHKWTVQRDGYYRITVDIFRETINAEYLGTEDPTLGIKPTTTTSLNDVSSIYSISGTKLPEMQQGVNIVNGKKILK